jgi:hypothetical protein
MFYSFHISTSAKRSICVSYIFSILLYGTECWSLTEKILDRLRFFHNHCICFMCRVSRKHTWGHLISLAKLCKRIGLYPIDYYMYCRDLFCFGNVSRMDFSRLPHRMFSCWIPDKKPVGRPSPIYIELHKNCKISGLMKLV